MIDINLIRESPKLVKEAIKNRGYKLDIELLSKQDKEWRHLKKQAEELRYKRNKLTEEIMLLKKQEKDVSKLIKEAKDLPEQIKSIEDKIKELRSKIDETLLLIPNIPDKTIPIGENASKNKIVRTFGKKPKFTFKPRPHWQLCEDLNILDQTRGVKIAESGFYMLSGLGAKLERALISLMLDLHEKQGYKEMQIPFLVNRNSGIGSAQIPILEKDMYKCQDENLYLVPTSEVSLLNIHRDEILEEEQLPLCYTSYSPCFRKEAGTHGTAERGIVRVHQFNKVEMFKFTDPKTSFKELEKMLPNAEQVLKLLKIPYRILLLCTGDMGFASAKTYDIEAWAPGVNSYLEVSSCSNCTDFQARRANIKHKTSEGNKLVHTLNGSGLALPRTFIALVENYQQKDGSIKIPKLLQKYMGIKKIERKGL